MGGCTFVRLWWLEVTGQYHQQRYYRQKEHKPVGDEINLRTSHAVTPVSASKDSLVRGGWIVKLGFKVSARNAISGTAFACLLTVPIVS